MRQGGPKDIQLERFEEALHDPTTGLTYTALSGVRKQSVEDVERLFGDPLITWMEGKGYRNEAAYLTAVRGWRRATDERGLSDVQRAKLSAAFRCYILDEFMPWHKDSEMNDYSYLEVNRYANTNLIFSMYIIVRLIYFCSCDCHNRVFVLSLIQRYFQCSRLQ